MQLLDALTYNCTVFLAERYVLAFAELTAVYTAYGNSAYIAAEVQ